VRWAWRLFRREWRQQVLVLSLVTVALAAAVAAGTILVNAVTPLSGEFGSGGAVTRVQLASLDQIPSITAAAERRFGTIEVVRHETMPVPGRTSTLDVRAQAPHGPYGGAMLRLLGGRFPLSADEVALTNGAAALLDARLGDTVTIDRVARRVVGHVENPGRLDDEFALLAPAPDAPATSLTILLSDATFRQRSEQDRPSQTATKPPNGAADGSSIDFGVMTSGDDTAAVATLVIVGTTVAMLLVSLVATAGFLVVGRRRQRPLGLLAALGASERHQRLVLVANGAIVGLVSALLGGVLGLVVWVGAAPAVEAAANHRMSRADIPWTLVLVSAALAVVASTAAAWWPARNLSRQPVVAALARRPITPSPVHRSALSSIVLVGAGVAGMFISHVNDQTHVDSHVRPLVLITSLVALVLGVVLASPLAVRALALPAAKLPFAPRLALRDLLRHQGRAAAALAAVTLALGVSVATAIAAQASIYGADEGNLSSHQLLVVPPGGTGPKFAQAAASPNASSADNLDDAVARITAVLGSGATRFPLDVAVSAHRSSTIGPEPISVVRPVPHGFNFAGNAYVASAELLEHNGLSPSSIRPDTDLVTALTGQVTLFDVSNRGALKPSVVQRIHVPSYTSAPTSLITAGALERNGWGTHRAAWFIDSPRALTKAQRTTAQRIAATTGTAIEVRSTQDAVATLRKISTGIGMAVALFVVALTVGLLRGESTADLRTLTATGASPRTRRALTAATAASLATLGVLLGIVGAYVALAAGYHATLDKLSSPPLATLLTMGLGTPLLAVVLGWLLGGREPSTISRAALD
jgi:putative ABC transport system permease protein